MCRLIYLFLLLHCWGCLRLNLLNTVAKNKQTEKTGNFNRGECLGSPLIGYGPAYEQRALALSVGRGKRLKSLLTEPSSHSYFNYTQRTKFTSVTKMKKKCTTIVQPVFKCIFHKYIGQNISLIPRRNA